MALFKKAKSLLENKISPKKRKLPGYLNINQIGDEHTFQCQTTM